MNSVPFSVLFCRVGFLVILSLAQCLFAEELPEILVTAPPPEIGLFALSAENLRTAPDSSLSGLLAWSGETSSVRRGSGQADLSIRGSSFEQTGVFLDGFPIRDPQTGHFNLEIPLPMILIGAVDIFTVPWGGSRGLAGSVNLQSRVFQKPWATLETSVGSFGTIHNALAVGLPSASLWGETSRSSCDRQDTDWRSESLGGKIRLDSLLNSNALVSYTHRKFGANDFYGSFPLFDELEETETFWGAWRGQVRGALGKWEPGIFWRRHKDHYWLDRYGRSSYENIHTNQTVGAESLFSRGPFQGRIHAKREWLESSNLGFRCRASSGISGCLTHANGLFGLETAFLRDGTAQISPIITVRTQRRASFLLAGSVSRAYREPSFTELYYRDPKNEGNSALHPEYSWNCEISPEWYRTPIVVKAVGFLRMERELIDWVREDPTRPWRSLNIGRATVHGLAGRAEWKKTRLHLLAQYDFLLRKADFGELQSKYALNYARHKGEIKAITRVGPLEMSARFSRFWRTDRTIYNLAEGRIAFNMKQGCIYGSVVNMLNEIYEEVGGVPMPRRAITIGMNLVL